MSDDGEPFVSYMCFGTNGEDTIPRSFAVLPDQDEVGRWKREQINSNLADGESGTDAEESESTTLDDEGTDLTREPSIELLSLMSRFQETMSSYKFLVGFGMTLMPTLGSHFIHNEIYKNANEHLALVDKDQQFEIYGITDDQSPPVKTQVRRLREIDKGVTVLPGAILLSLVATFDSFIADTLRIMLRNQPDEAIESSKLISVRDVMKMSSLDEVKRKITDDEVEALMRGTHDTQIKYVEDKFHINIRDYYEEWGEFIEIFERRNIIAHGNYIINSHYVRHCNDHGHRVDEDQCGERLSLDEQYLRKSSDRLLEFGLSLMFVLRLKHFRESRETAYEEFSDLTYGLIRDGQSRVAANLLDLALFKQTPKVSDQIIRMMTVNLANAYKKIGNAEMAYQVITGLDWSASREDFQICVAAIMGDIHRVVELMPNVHQGGWINKSQFREWPVFDWAREEVKVREKFQEVYGEPIIVLNDQENTS